MSEFGKLRNLVEKNLERLQEYELFWVDIPDIKALYQNSFPDGTNEIFRERREYDCNCCNSFLRKFGAVVAVYEGSVHTLWGGGEELPYPFDVVARIMNDVVKQAPIVSVFRTNKRVIGEALNFGPDGARYEHFTARIPGRYYSDTPEKDIAKKKEDLQVFERGLKDFKIEHVDQILELINEDLLYKGREYKDLLEGFRQLLILDETTVNDRQYFLAEHSNSPYLRIRNSVIGTLLKDLAAGTSLEVSVKKYTSVVDPRNVHRSKSLVTQKQIDAALEKIKELGIESAVHRRHAFVSDISVNDVLFVDNLVRSELKDGLESLMVGAAKKPKKKKEQKDILEVSYEKFFSTILPNLVKIEALVQTKHSGNFMTVTGADSEERIFKWDNNFAWSYDGDVTDSIKERVREKGGQVDAALRVSLSWNNEDDLDIHLKEPNGKSIYFGCKKSRYGELDVDMNCSGAEKNAVENIAYSVLPPDGKYVVSVDNYRNRPRSWGEEGFSLQIQDKMGTTTLVHSSPLRRGEERPWVNLTLENGILTVEPQKGKFEVGTITSVKWGISTEEYHPVSVVMNSPNHWDGEGVGSRHWFFILKGCENPDPVRGIYTEFLRSDLHEHRKVLEILGAKTKAPFSKDQLSGLGFTVGRSDSITLRTTSNEGSLITYEVKF